MLGADETSIRVDGSLAWVHAARTDDLTLYTISRRRGVEAIFKVMHILHEHNPWFPQSPLPLASHLSSYL